MVYGQITTWKSEKWQNAKEPNNRRNWQEDKMVKDKKVKVEVNVNPKLKLKKKKKKKEKKGKRKNAWKSTQYLPEVLQTWNFQYLLSQ